MRLSAAEWALAKDICTAKQIAALDLWRRGAGAKRIGLILDIDESTAQEHVRRGLRNVAKAQEDATA